MSSVSGYLPARWKIGSDGGNIITLISEVNFSNYLPFAFVFKLLQISFLELKSPNIMETVKLFSMIRRNCDLEYIDYK